MSKVHQIIVAAALAAGLIAAPALVQTAASQDNKAASAKTAATKKPPSPSQLAARARLKKCGAEWKEAKASGKIEKGMKWSRYWSACNKRLKEAKGS
jgi:curli biogenesis system outer membrane secretion channel CsgG